MHDINVDKYVRTRASSPQFCCNTKGTGPLIPAERYMWYSDHFSINVGYVAESKKMVVMKDEFGVS